LLVVVVKNTQLREGPGNILGDDLHPPYHLVRFFLEGFRVFLGLIGVGRRADLLNLLLA
jgi:hypothetical protein